jgi:long-subunit fatty acid transport protein
VEKTFGEVFSIKVSAKADITTYTSKNLATNVKFNNNIFQLAPELIYSKENITIHGGVSPTWDNGKLSLLPNIYGVAQLKDKPFLVEAGLIGRITKNSYRNLSFINP